MTLAIVTATPTEMTAVLKGFNGRGRTGCNMPEQGKWCETPVNGHDCILAVTGVGPINAAVTIGRLLGQFSLSGVLCLGVAGSFDLIEAPLGAPLFVSEEIFPEYGLVTKDGTDAKGIAFPQLPPTDGPDSAVWDRVALNPIADAQALDLSVLHLSQAASLTVSGVTGTPARAAHLQHRYNAMLENMEGFSLALACTQANIPFIELRTVSNLVGSRRKEDWRLDEALLVLGKTARELFL